MESLCSDTYASMIVTDIASNQEISSWNRQTYQRLKLALSIGLRRQLFLAVCDDLNLRNQLADQLYRDLGLCAANGSSNHQGYPKLVSLNLNLSEPNPLAQISQWLTDHEESYTSESIPGFQILGIENLTRQPAALQRLFLRHLQSIGNNLSYWELTFLLWLPRPWFYSIQQSVPEFWQQHTGFFEFEGEPTPLSQRVADTAQASYTLPPSTTVIDPGQEDVDKLPGQEDVLIVESFNVEASNDNFQSNNMRLENHSETLQDNFKINNQPPATEIETPQDNWEQNNLQPGTQKPSTGQTYLELGNHYRYLIEQGDASEENLVIAIQAYEQALQWSKFTPIEESAILNDVGNFYWMLSRCPNNDNLMVSYLEQAIKCYQVAVTDFLAEQSPEIFSMIQNNLGTAYGELAQYQDLAKNLENSIHAYEDALRYGGADHDLVKYASTQNNLGTAYWNLAQYQSPVPNLKKAIAAYQEAISDDDTTANPQNWAMIQNNLGTTYWSLAQHEQPTVWLKLAIFAYQDALKYRKPEVDPAGCAATQNNLGTAYWHLGDQLKDESGAKTEYLKECMRAYENALVIAGHQPHPCDPVLNQNRSPVPVNFDIIATYNNLGLVNFQLATQAQFSLTKGSKLTHLEAALHQHVQACMGTVDQPETYQISLNYLIHTIRAFSQENGPAGQSFALSKVPGQLLPEILPRL